jgi:long-chain acyl-CoA synthetase
MSAQPWTKYYPAGALDDLGVSGRLLPDLLASAATNWPARTALTSPTTAWTFERLRAEAEQLAGRFRSAGVAGDARVAIMLPNMPEYVAALFATWLAGGTVVQVNPAYVAVEVGRILDHSGPAVLVTTREQLTGLRDAGVAASVAVCLVGEGTEPVILDPGAPSAGPQRRDWPDQSSEIAVLQYTGGTTGLPKAVMLTHQNILSNIEQRLRLTFLSMAVPDGAKIVNTLPMCHVFGLTCVTLTGVRAGMNQLIVPRFRVRPVLELIRDARPFAFFGVPTMYAGFLREPDLEQFGLDRVTVFNSAGAPMPPAQLAHFEARVGARVLDGFGISEAAPSTHTNPPFLPRREGSSGIPVPFTEARTIELGDGLVDVPPGETGELAIRGPQVMKGYWGEPELTAKTLRDGWLLTGDLARIDEDGYLYIVGRSKDVIVASGFNVYPAEIERVIGEVDGVAEVAVVGIPHDYRGETVKAVIVPTHGATVDLDAVIARCRAELAPFKVPTVVEIIDELPRTAVGKTDKRRLATAQPSPAMKEPTP